MAAGCRIHTRVFTADSRRLPVVLLHGLVVSGRYMEPLARQLGWHRTAYVPDLPGFGRSASPQQTLAVGELAWVVSVWMDAVGVARGHVLANSFGCPILAELACLQPTRIATAVMVGPTGDPAIRSRLRLAGLAIRSGLHEPMSETAIVLADYVRAGLRRSLATSRLAVEHRMEPAVTRMPAPLLVARGEHDPIASQPWCRRLSELAQRGRFATLREQWHAAHYSAPGLVAALVEPFMTDCE